MAASMSPIDVKVTREAELSTPAEAPILVASFNGATGLPEELAAFFPSLDLELVRTIVSDISRSHPHYSLEELRDEAVDSLLEISDEAAARQSPSRDDMSPEAATRLDESLAALLSLNDRALVSCVQSLVTIMRRIQERPNEAQLRQLNQLPRAFEVAVGRQRPAQTLIVLAGFEEFELDGKSTLVFHGNPHTSIRFLRVKRALEELLDACAPAVPAYPVVRANPGMQSTRARRVTFAQTASRSYPVANTAGSTAGTYASQEDSANDATRLRKRDRLRAFLSQMRRKESRPLHSSQASNVSSPVQAALPGVTPDSGPIEIELLETEPASCANTCTDEHEVGPQPRILRASALTCRTEASEDQEAESLVGWAR